MVLICPYPKKWHEVHERLRDYAGAHACDPSQPPPPFILAGWSSTNDVEKMRRWSEMVAWAAANGCAEIVEGIPDQDFYQVAKPSDYDVGPLGGPCYRPWDFESKERPSPEDIARDFDHLCAHWRDIAGPILAGVTRPLAFTGKKMRRLLVEANGAVKPPWGEWSRLSPDPEKQRTFTRLRAAVNEAIAPRQVDHIEFITKQD